MVAMRSIESGMKSTMQCSTSSNGLKWMQTFLRFFFKHLYTTFAWVYDLVAFLTSAGQWRTWQKLGVDSLPPGQVLEIGYGTGHVLSMLHSRGQNAIGIDLSKQMAQIANGRLKKLNYPPNLIRAKAQALPFGKNAFPSILSTFPSEYIFQMDTLTEIWRTLKPEGVLIIIPGVSEILGLKAEGNKILGLLDEMISILYRVTGEAIDTKANLFHEVTNQLMNLGFSVNIQHVRLKRAVLLHVKAIKKGNPNELTHG